MQSVHQGPQAAQKSLKMYHIHEDYPTSDHSGDKTLQIYTKACFRSITFECCRELRRGLQSGFLEHHVIMSTTISYKGQGGQKCRGWLSCCYIFLRPAWLWFTLECKSCPLHRANGCGSRVNFASPLDKEVMDGLRPPTAWHSGATSSALKPWNDNAAKSIELNVGSKHTWRQNQAQNWKRVCKKKTKKTGEIIFLEYLCTLKALFWASLVPWAAVLQTEWLNSTTQTWRMWRKRMIRGVCRGRPSLLWS